MAASGCSSTKIYKPSTLPQAWQAIPTANTQTIDLSQLASTTVPENRIARGDVLEITVAAGSGRDDSNTLPARVNDDGTVLVLHVGQVYVEGLEFSEAEAEIMKACVEKEIYREPIVTVTPKRQKMNRITVMGGVEKPQVVELRSGNSDVLQAISAAGGLSKEAGTIVEVRHPGFRPSNEFHSPPVASRGRDGNELASHKVKEASAGAHSFTINLASLGKDKATSYELQDGSVINVEKRDPPALQVLGLVHKPNRYEFPLGKNLRLLDAVSLAGGLSNSVADKVFVIRRRRDAEPMLVQVSLRKAKRKGTENILLEPGDTVSIEQTPGTIFIDAVRAVGVNLGGAIF
jgi:polysaccharide biosynthesis/export protein